VSPRELYSRLARPGDGRLLLLVLDGLGDLRTAAQPETALEGARTPNLDALARRAALGRTLPVAYGVTPGSGPGHLALFGYDPLSPEADIGRGALEALGMGIDVAPGDVVARGNFATADADGNLIDRRAGRIPTDECVRLCTAINDHLASAPSVPGLTAQVFPGEGYRFVLRLRGPGLSADLEDTDPQILGVPPLPPKATGTSAGVTVERLAKILPVIGAALVREPKANRFLLRGFASLPHLSSLESLYGLRSGCFAGYPLYRGVSKAVGMTVAECGKSVRETFAAAAAGLAGLDFTFVHVKGTDQAGEDGDLAAKVAVIEEVDRELPVLLAALDSAKDVLAITGDHSTPAPMKSHSWHPVPVLLAGPHAFVDGLPRFTEGTCIQGHLGTFPAMNLLGLMLANAGRLEKFGA
jgi:2,3-bisphosphoglycerate-independent phosphoglycerate mutase